MTERPTTAHSPASSRREIVTLALEPLDVLFFGDGRPFEPATRAAGQTPTPQAVAGAVRTWLLRRAGGDPDALGEAIRNGGSFAEAAAEQGGDVARIGRIECRGPFFVRCGERLTPTPATLECSKDDPCRLFRLDPLSRQPPGWAPPEHLAPPVLKPLWKRSGERTERCRGYLRPEGLRRFLAGGLPLAEHVIDKGDLFLQEERTGIGLDPARRTAKEGLIYQVGMLRLQTGVSLAVDLVGAPGDLAACPEGEDILALGGEGRRAVVKRTGAGREPGPAAHAPCADAAGALVVLSTPGLFEDWKPAGLTPVAAAVRGYLPVSGWDLARRGPKPTRFAVPGGGVYFLGPSPDLDPVHGTLCTGEDAAAGWGAYHLGEWNHA